MPAQENLQNSILAHTLVLSELVASHLEPTLDKAGITFGTFELLSAVSAGGSKVTQAELARRLGITPPSLTEAVQSAARKNLVEQTASGVDQRSKRVRLTKQGQDVLRQVVSATARVEEAALDGIPMGDVAQAIRTLREVISNLNRTQPPET